MFGTGARAGFDVQTLGGDDRLITAQRCVSKGSAQCLAPMMKRQHMLGGWVE
jgi:hypothetical protein